VIQRQVAVSQHHCAIQNMTVPVDKPVTLVCARLPADQIRIVLLMSGVLEDSAGQFAIVIPNVVPNRSVKTDYVMWAAVVTVCALTMNPVSTNSVEILVRKVQSVVHVLFVVL